MGETNPEIAAALGLSRNTVKTYLQRSLEKLGARNRVEALSRASQLGILHDPSVNVRWSFSREESRHEFGHLGRSLQQEEVAAAGDDMKPRVRDEPVRASVR